MEQKQQREEIELDLREVFGALLRKIWVILFVGIIAALGALLASQFLITKMYESTTKVYVLNKQDNTMVTYTDLQTGTQLTKDYMELVTSRPVTDQVISDLGLVFDSRTLAGMITVQTPQDTRILKITVRDKDPYQARDIANAVREASATHISNVMDIKSVNVVEKANLPERPASPNVMKNTLIGGVLGCFLAVFAVLLLFLLDDTVKTPDDVEKYLGVSVLGSIPVASVAGEKKKKNWFRRRRAKVRGKK